MRSTGAQNCVGGALISLLQLLQPSCSNTSVTTALELLLNQHFTMHALLAIVPLYLSRVQLVREALPVALPLCRWGEAHVGQHAWPMCLHDPSIDNHVSPTIARTGCWECPTVQDMLAMLRAHRNASLLDIGANIGYYSLAAAASGAAARVNAFEASPRNVLMLQQSVSRSRLEGVVTVHAMALGAAPGLLRLGVSKKNQGGLHHLEGAGGTQVPQHVVDAGTAAAHCLGLTLGAALFTWPPGGLTEPRRA